MDAVASLPFKAAGRKPYARFRVTAATDSRVRCYVVKGYNSKGMATVFLGGGRSQGGPPLFCKDCLIKVSYFDVYPKIHQYIYS